MRTDQVKEDRRGNEKRSEVRSVTNGAELRSEEKPAQPRTRRQNVRDDGLVRSHRLQDVISE
jgi:hypothetical protein